MVSEAQTAQFLLEGYSSCPVAEPGALDAAFAAVGLAGVTRSEAAEKSWTDVAAGRGVVRRMKGGPDSWAGIESRRTCLAGVAEPAGRTCCGHVDRGSG